MREPDDAERAMWDEEATRIERVVLRDQFAIAALTSATQMALTAAAFGRDPWTTPQIAECAYQFADAMLAERERAK